MEVITIETESFYKLIQSVVERIKAEHNITEDKWISGEEAMRKLRISSKTTLQKLRNEGKVKFSQPERKIILYDVESIYQFLDKNSKETF
ncbi:helix-turn-helix domain-containing protein [Ferruginibacter sp.]|nr:helix-turn-helix domain-containing protein [Ferruginibacter sp.]